MPFSSIIVALICKFFAKTKNKTSQTSFTKIKSLQLSKKFYRNKRASKGLTGKKLSQYNASAHKNEIV